MKKSKLPESIPLDKLSELILSDCRKLGADEREIASIKKNYLIKTTRGDTRDGFHFTYDSETRSYWLDDFEKGKASGGIEDVSALNFRFKFVRDFILHDPPKNLKNKEKWETFLRQTCDDFSTAADYQTAVQDCLWRISGFISPVPYKPYLPWMGVAIPVGSERVQASSKEELDMLGIIGRRWPLTYYKGELHTMVNDNDSAQWRAWNRHEAMLRRRDKAGFFHVSSDELENVSAARFEVRLLNREDWFPVVSLWGDGRDMSCLIADPEYQLPYHTETSERNYGALVEIDLYQAEEVRLWLGTPVIDPLKIAPQSLQNAVEAYHRDTLVAEIKESIRKDKKEARNLLTSEEDFLKAIQEEGLDQKFDFRMNDNHSREGSIRLNRLEDGSYELYHVGERGVDARERFQDPFEAFYTTRQWLRRTPLADFSSADHKQNTEEQRKGSVMWNGTMISVELDEVRDSSIQELRASEHGVSDTRLIAKYENELYHPGWLQGKIRLWRDGKEMLISPDEIDEIYAAQFDVRVQGKWFLCFGVAKTDPAEDSFDCLIDDPNFKLPSLHSQHSNYMWGSGIEINSSQIEAVRLWRSKPLTDLPTSNGAET